jgi:hypothetical protein
MAQAETVLDALLERDDRRGLPQLRGRCVMTRYWHLITDDNRKW